MADIVVRVGNTAPTVPIDVEASQHEVDEAAGTPKAALYHKHVDDEGNERFTKQAKRPFPGGPRVTTFHIPHAKWDDDDPVECGTALKDMSFAWMNHHSNAAPEWVHCVGSSNGALWVAKHLGRKHPDENGEPAHVEVFNDADLEAIIAGPQPTILPDGTEIPPMAGGAIQAVGRDQIMQALFDLTSYTGTSTGTAATTLTDSGATWTSNQWAGHSVSCGGKLATINSNTATALTHGGWETPGSRSGAVASTPGATTLYTINSGQDPAVWVALTANTGTPSTGGGDTTLTGEIATASGGLVRAVAVYAHTTGTNTASLTNTFTANGSDVLPVVVAKIGVLQARSGGRLLFETLLGSTATLNNPGDNVQCSDTDTTT